MTEFLAQRAVKPYFGHEHPAAFAHRGFTDTVNQGRSLGENTLGAFRAAVDRGITYLELDVRTSSDRVLMVFHDETLERVTGAHGRVCDYTAAELAKFPVGEGCIATFEEVVLAFPNARFNVDLKDEDSVELMADLLRAHQLNQRVLVASFADGRRRRFLRSVPFEVASSAGWVSIALFVLGARWLPERLVRRLLADVDVLQVPVVAGPLRIVSARNVAKAHRLGLPVHVWTVNDKRQMHHLFDLGVDGIMSDRADLLAEVMRERGYWN